MRLQVRRPCPWATGFLFCLALLFSLHRYGAGEFACTAPPHPAGQVIDASHGLSHALDGRQAPLAAPFLTSQSTPRFGSTRPLKVLVTHGTKSHRGPGQRTRTEYANPQRHIFLRWQRWHVLPLLGTSPPCHYYVFALRRILR